MRSIIYIPRRNRMVNQKTAVTNAVLSLFPDYQLGGEVILKDLLNTHTKKQLVAMVAQGFEAQEVSMSAEAQAKYIGNPTGLTKYTTGLVDNWVRKNKEFNNGQKYITKNPGSRAGSQDDTVKALRNLLKQTPDADAQAEIQEALTQRLAEIKPAGKSVEINIDHLPESLRHLVS